MTLSARQQAWLDAYMADGTFSSVEEALAHLIDERIAEEQDDLDWAKPLVDEAIAEVDRGEVLSLEDLKARSAKRLAALRP